MRDDAGERDERGLPALEVDVIAAQKLRRPGNGRPGEWAELISGEAGEWAMAVHGGAPVPICHTRAANRASRAVARALGLALPGWIWTVR